LKHCFSLRTLIFLLNKKYYILEKKNSLAPVHCTY